MTRPDSSVANHLPWRFAASAPEGVEVETKIDDEHGVRNVQTLMRREHLWWYPDGTMYVYYCPTHWRPLRPEE